MNNDGRSTRMFLAGGTRRQPEQPEIAKPVVDCAVVIAAGAGSRLRSTSRNDDVPKPMTPALGVPLVCRTLMMLEEEGIREAIVVTGYRAEEIRRPLERDPRLAGLRLRIVNNAEWRKKNGLSVLAAREAVGDRPFLLSMGDHLYSRDVVRALMTSPPRGELLLAIDRRVTEIADPEDAMWVRLLDDGRITDIGKNRPHFDAVDTGVFLTSPALFEALASVRTENGGDCTLADGVRRLAEQGRAWTVDIGDAWWQDVDTRADLIAVERKLIAASRGREAGAVLREPVAAAT